MLCVCVSDSVRLLAMVKWKRSPDGRTDGREAEGGGGGGARKTHEEWSVECGVGGCNASPSDDFGRHTRAAE